MQIRAIIVDDEPLARQIIQQYAQDIPDLEIVCSCPSAIAANKAISETAIDLMFLDVDMPKLSGIDFIKNLAHPPLVVLTTAYTDYAVEGYELNVLDYLKKPFSFERFFKSVQKAEQQLQLLRKTESDKAAPAKAEYIFVKADKKVMKVEIDNIVVIEGLGDYIKIHTRTGHLVTNLSMKKMEEQLPDDQFVRIHKSFIVRLEAIQAIDGNMVEIGNQKLPIGNNFRHEFNGLIEKRIIK